MTRLLGDNFRVMMRVFEVFLDFRRVPDAGEALDVGAILEMSTACVWVEQWA